MRELMMFTERVSKFLNELLKKGYKIKVENEEVPQEEKAVGNLIIIAEDNLLKKVYTIKISIMDGKEYVYKLIPVTDRDKIDNNYWFTHCDSLKKDRNSYNFEHEYKYVDNDLHLKYIVHEWKDMNDDFFNDDNDIIFEDTEVIDVKDILTVLKNNFSIEQLLFMQMD